MCLAAGYGAAHSAPCHSSLPCCPKHSRFKEDDDEGWGQHLPVPKRSEDHRQLSSYAAELWGKERLLSWIQAKVIILPCPIAAGDVGFN